MKDFAEAKVVVTGGSRGVGRAIAERFGGCGASVAVVFRSSRAGADEAVAAIEAAGGKGLAIQADLADPAAADDAVARAVDAFGHVDILAHSAGAQVEWRSVRDHTPESFGAFVSNDLLGAFNVIHPVVRHMHERRSGVIVAISSIAAQMCQARNAQGAAAKAGLEALIRVIAREEGRYGIRANAVGIGLTDTDQAREALAQWGEEATQKIIAGIPLQRMGWPEEIADFVAYLCSEYGSYFTGKVIQLDGGQIIAG